MVTTEEKTQDPIEMEIPSVANDAAPAEGAAKPAGPRRYIAMAAFGIIALAVAFKGYGAYSFGQTHVNTDNAYVTGDLVNISPIVSGTLSELKVADGDFVHKGQLIARLDVDSSSAVLAQAEANLKAAEAQVPQAEAELAYTKLSTQAAIQGSQAAIANQSAKTQGSRMQVLLSTQTVHNQILQAQAQLNSAKSQTAQADAGVAEAQAGLNVAKLAVQTAQRNAESTLASEMSAKADATRADKDLHRYQDLFREDAISQQQLDAATATASSTAANYAAASQRTQASNSQVAQAESAVAQAQSRLAAAISQAQSARSQVQVASAGLGLARANGTQVSIQGTNVTSNEHQIGQADANLLSAQAGVQQIALREKQIAAAKAQLAQAQAAVDHARVDVQDASLYAPCDGYVVKHAANVGAAINPGQTIVTITHGTDVWVMANFKETQLDKVREGQTVDMEVDAYPGRTFKGKVLSILDATGSATTLLPPDNSTGNFTKVVQRVPVKISIQSESASDAPRLRQGMSVDATIDTASSSKE
jgi:membrane fusion protein (multidrug efflux system)